MQSATDLSKTISKTYTDLFGETPLFVRLDDIMEEANELVAWTDEDNLKEELSDLLGTCFALAAEKDWPIEELVAMNLAKMKERKENGHYERTGEAKA